jgi:exodeoxyribonuclease V gamma subunit
MLFTYYSNRLEALAAQLIAVFDQPQQGISPLQPLTVLVQSSGMARWLSLQFARQSGVAANVHYPFLASFVWQVYRAQHPELPHESTSDKPILLWRLLKLFESAGFSEDFHELAAYLGGDQPMLKRYQLAAAIADVFDQYLIYRPDWMQAWEKGGDDAWQARLWRLLVRSAPENDPHRAHVHRQVLSAAGRLSVQKLPDKLAVIGISSMPPAYLDLLSALAQQIDIHVFVLNPSLHYWGDLPTPRQQARALAQFGLNAEDVASRSHSLLASMGRQGQEFISLLQTHASDETAVFIDPAAQGGNLLSALQRDVLLLTTPESAASTQRPAGEVEIDNSVRIVSCHSIVRELEVLHDALLDYFDRHPQAKPDDVVVMVPAIDDYAPYIQAVFGAQPLSRRLPFSVSDRTPTTADALLTCFLQLLDLPDQRFTHSAVVEVLRNPAVQRRYRIEDFDALLDMIERSQIRWGLDQSDWQPVGVDTRQNTWAFGLDRLFAGYAFGEDIGSNTVALAGEPIAPLQAGGSAAALDIGALSRFVRDLQLLSQLRSERTPAQWLQHVDALVDRFFETDDAEAMSASRIRAAMQTLQKHTALAEFEGNISYDVVRDYLQQALDSKSQGQQYFNGAITFCTLMPMRSLPFAVVCMLGLNDATFPRRQNPVSFDLIAAQPRKGDRNRRHEDRYLFLEAVLAAREQLYISYIGHSIVDNSAREPSVLVSELIDVLCRYPRVTIETLVCQHPLQAFDTRYFSVDRFSAGSDDHLFSYAADWLPAARNSRLPLPARKSFDFSAGAPASIAQQASAQLALRRVELDDLLDWASHPSRHLLRRLGVELVRQDDQLLDDEHFDADGLVRYQLAHEGVDAAADSGVPFDALLQRWSVAGQLPVGAVGRAVADTLQQALQPFVQLAAGAGRFDARRSIDIVIGNLAINGVIGRLGESGRFEARYSAMKGRNLLPAWLQHLLLGASGHACSSRLLLRDADVRFEPVPQDEALVWLTKLLDAYVRSVDLLQPVYVDLSFSIAARENDGEEQKIAGDIDKFHADDENTRGLYSDEHDSYLFGARPVDDVDDFVAVARQLFGGIFAYMSNEELDADAGAGSEAGS